MLCYTILRYAMLNNNVLKLVVLQLLISGAWILHITAHTLILPLANGNKFLSNVFFSIFHSLFYYF